MNLDLVCAEHESTNARGMLTLKICVRIYNIRLFTRKRRPSVYNCVIPRRQFRCTFIGGSAVEAKRKDFIWDFPLQKTIYLCNDSAIARRVAANSVVSCNICFKSIAGVIHKSSIADSKGNSEKYFAYTNICARLTVNWASKLLTIDNPSETPLSCILVNRFSKETRELGCGLSIRRGQNCFCWKK